MQDAEVKLYFLVFSVDLLVPEGVNVVRIIYNDVSMVNIRYECKPHYTYASGSDKLVCFNNTYCPGEAKVCRGK